MRPQGHPLGCRLPRLRQLREAGRQPSALPAQGTPMMAPVTAAIIGGCLSAIAIGILLIYTVLAAMLAEMRKRR